MKLRRQRDLLALAQVALATIGVAGAGGTSWWMVALAGLFAVHAFVRPLPPQTAPAAQRRWTTLVLLAVAVTVYRAVARSEVLDAGVDLLLVLVIQRLYCRQRTREHLQLMLIGGLLMTIGAVINVDLNYPLLLVPYFVLIAMGLLLNQLTAAGERLGPAAMWAIDRHARRSQRVLWRSGLQIAALVAFGGVAVFFVFPRFGAGTFVRGPSQTRLTSGFSEEVQLGQFGAIRDDASVVMRVVPDRPPDQRPTYLPVYFRGSSFDRYEDGRWAHSDGSFTAGLRRLKSVWAVTDVEGRLQVRVDRQRDPLGRIVPRRVDGYAASTQSSAFDITLEDIGTELLFTPGETLFVQVWAATQIRRVRPGHDAQLILPDRPAGAIRYYTQSRLVPPTAAELEAVGNPARELPERYVQTPDVLSLRFRELAADLVRGADSRAARVDAVLEYLAGFEYSTDLRPFSAAVPDPVEGFLFESRRGHCEYFATTAALLLREAGVPTRLVNGYLGADWNPVGEYFAVRQAHAHSWIEVHFGRLGWVRVDPTPPAGRPGPGLGPISGELAQWVDALRNRYLQYVIDYGFDDQRALLQGLGLRRSADRSSAWPPRVPVLATLGTVGLLLVLIRRWRRRVAVPRETKIAQRVLRSLARAGFARRSDESLSALAQRVAARDRALAAGLAEFARRYDAVRFGDERSPASLRQLQDAARRMSQLVPRGVRQPNVGPGQPR
ncbi:MAG: DUF3488 domain-containing protein [Myxococcales bacterium FL481]|nr:MAG: DUF3488 domain-containing protein [Myxococcales bacterium FL481]